MKQTFLVVLALTSATFVISQTTSGYQNTGAEAEAEDDITPEPEIIPDSERETNESTTDSEHSEEEGHSEGTGHVDEEEAYSEDTPDVWDARPENNPVVENGVLNLPFYDFDGPVPNDYFIPEGERSEPTESNSEPEKVPEYWWENEPEYFYDDEYAYLNALAAGEVEPEGEARGEKKADPEGEAEPEYEAEPEGRVEPEFEYLYTFKNDKKTFGAKKVLRILIAILSVVWGSLGAVIIVLSYRGHNQYREAKLRTLEDQSDVKMELDSRKLCSGLIYLCNILCRQKEDSAWVSEEKKDTNLRTEITT